MNKIPFKLLFYYFIKTVSASFFLQLSDMYIYWCSIHASTVTSNQLRFPFHLHVILLLSRVYFFYLCLHRLQIV